MTDSLRIGLIGAGRIGRVHAENITNRTRRATMAAIADANPDTASAAAREYGAESIYDDYRAVTEHSEIDAVVICSPTDTHLEVIEAAAAAGKHIFCEKPVAATLDEIDQALAVAERASVKLQVGFNRRFDASFRRLRDAVESGEIGEPHLLHIVSRDPAPPPIDYVRRSGGMFLDMTAHDFDMARFLIGSEIAEVYTLAANRVDPAIGEAGDVDTAVITLRFENGVIGTIDNSRRAVYGYDQRAEVFGSGGSATTGNHFPHSVTVSTAESVARDLPLHFFIERYAESYRAEMQAFVDAVLEDTPVPVDGRDGRTSVVLGMVARRSYDEGRPVRVEWG